MYDSVHVNMMTLFISEPQRAVRHLANTQDEVQNVVPVLEVCQRPLCFFCRCKVTDNARTLCSLFYIITISKCVYFDFFSQYSNMRQVPHQRHHRFPRRCSPSHPVHSFLQTRRKSCSRLRKHRSFDWSFAVLSKAKKD